MKDRKEGRKNRGRDQLVQKPCGRRQHSDLGTARRLVAVCRVIVAGWGGGGEERLGEEGLPQREETDGEPERKRPCQQRRWRHCVAEAEKPGQY